MQDWNSDARGLWSDGTTLWVSDGHGAVSAYRLSDGVRQADRDLDRAVMRAAGNSVSIALWSDGEVMLVADPTARRVFAYRMSDGARVISREIMPVDAPGAAVRPTLLWSDGDLLLLAAWDVPYKLLAYTPSDLERREDRDIDITPFNYLDGLWVGGETLWLANGRPGASIRAWSVPGFTA